MNLFIIGPSGCGKSTQAKLVAEKFNLTHFSMGQLFRDELSAQSPVGLEIKSYVDRGIWVPNEVTFKVLTENLAKINYTNFIVDGYPRQLDQGIKIEEFLKEKNQQMNAIIHLRVTAQEIVDRRNKQAAAGTRFSDANRTDETPESIAARQQSYDDTINPIIDYYKDSNKFWDINGNRPIEPIFEDICTEINKI